MADNEDLKTEMIDKLLAKEAEEEKDLRFRLSQVQTRIKSLVHTRAMLIGQDTEDSLHRPLADLLESILQGGPQHVDQLVELTKLNFGRLAAKQTISGCLIRYANQGKRFRRVGKNKFALLDENKGKSL
jgi:hypothetical protein